MSRRDPGAATGQAAEPTPPVDWSRWRKCDVCGAETARPCRVLTGARIVPGRPIATFEEPADRPHHGRKQRTGGKP